MRLASLFAMACALVLLLRPVQLVAASPLRVKVSPVCSLLIDVRKDDQAACWRLQCKAELVRKLGCDFSALHQIAEVLISPKQDFLAVTSVGEGHPILELVPVAPLLKRGEYRALCEINPFPGTVLVQRWQYNAKGSAMLKISSDVDLTVQAFDKRASSIGESMREFWLDSHRCGIEMAALPGRATRFVNRTAVKLDSD